MINKTKLYRLADSSPLMRTFLVRFSKRVCTANSVEEYTDEEKMRFDRLIELHNICTLQTETYQESVREIYDALTA